MPLQRDSQLSNAPAVGGDGPRRRRRLVDLLTALPVGNDLMEQAEPDWLAVASVMIVQQSLNTKAGGDDAEIRED